MKIAIVYDRVNTWGGAERVLLALHELFPDAPLYTSVYNPQTAVWANVFTIKTSFLQRLPFATRYHQLFPFLMPLAFESFSFDEYDLVISVTSEAAKGIITKPATKHICYCLTPTRYLWSGYDTYFSNQLLRFASAPVVWYLRSWDGLAAQRPDVMVGISHEVSKRIKRYYGRETEVVYPPVTLAQGSKDNVQLSGSMQNRRAKPFFLIVSRLSTFTKYKRIDLAIKACNALKLPLKIIGTGNWEAELRAMAGPTVEFIGKVSDEELKEYYTSCRALLFPGIEDFGLTIVEAQQFGKPVIAFRGGGALETIIEGETGLFFDRQTKQSLMEALNRFEGLHFDSLACRQQAARFSTERFKKQFLSLVKDLMT